METVVVVLMILVSFNFLLKLTYCKLWTVGVIAVSACLFVGLMWPLAIEQSKTQIADWLSNPQLMLDTSVILSLEVVLQLAYCMLAAHLQTAGKVGSRTVLAYRCLRLFPGVLIFAVLFSLLAWVLGAAILILIPAGMWLLKWLLPEKEVRLELLFLCNALVAILGVVATVNGTTAVSASGDVDWFASLALLLLMLLGGLAGYVFRHLYMKYVLK